ncbi:MAG: cell division protein FtsA, partial [Candidatus Magasanikbacteria bacterium]
MVRGKNQANYITALDIGSTAIRVAIGQILLDREHDHTNIQIIGAIEVPSIGMQKGNVTSIEDLVSSVSEALEKAERLVGFRVENIWVGISGADIISQTSKGVVAVAKSDGEITQDDIDRAVEAARTINPPLNYEVLHVVPRNFSVDGQTGIKDPIGMTGMRLEVETQMVHGLSSHLKNITKAIYRTSVEIDDLVLSILAVGDAVTTMRQKELGVVVVNIGGPSTNMIVYEGGDIIHTAVLPIGSDLVTNDLAIGLRTSVDVAEEVKKHFTENITKKLNMADTIDLSDFGAQESELISKQYISEIMSARFAEIFDKINDELSKVDRCGMLPAGVVLTGGGVKVPGIVDLAKNELKLPVTLGYPIGVGGMGEYINDLGYATSV